MPNLYIVLIRNYNNFPLSIFKKVELTNVNDMSPVFDRTSFPPANKVFVRLPKIKFVNLKWGSPKMCPFLFYLS